MRTGTIAFVAMLFLSCGCRKNSPTVDSTPLIRAAASGDIEKTRVCLTRGENVNETDSYRRTPLSGAVRYGNAGLVELLLAHGADVNVRCDANAGTPLQIAVEQGWKSIIKLLVEHGAKLNCADKNGRTPALVAMKLGDKKIVQILAGHEGGMTLSVAAYLGDTDATKRLLEGGAKVDAKDAEGQTPLRYAAREGHAEVVELLLAKGANADGKGSGDTPLLDALWRRHVDVATVLVNHGARIEGEHSVSRMSPLHMAAQDGLTELVRLMIAKGARVNARDNAGNTALHYAPGADIAQFLLSNGADVNVKSRSGSTPLHYAAGRGQVDLVQLLIDNRAAIDPKDKRGQTPAAWAMQAGHREIVRLLAAHGAALTPHMAAYAGDVQTVRRLLDAGADVNQQDKEGRTPLYLATQEGYMEVMELLIARGADVNQGTGHDPGEFAPLYVAASCGRGDAIDLLVRRGAKVDARVDSSATPSPLYAAAQEGHRDAVAALVAAGAKINGPDYQGRTPLLAAAVHGHRDVVQFLLEKGADVTVGQMGREFTRPDPRLQTAADMTQYVLRAYAPYTIIVADPAVVRRFLQGHRIHFDDVWSPSAADLQGLDVALRSSVEKGPPTRRGAWLEHDYVLENLACYNREFAGFVDDNVRYLVCQMIFFGEFRETPPQNAFSMVADGGSGVLRVIFDADKKIVVNVDGNQPH